METYTYDTEDDIVNEREIVEREAAELQAVYGLEAGDLMEVLSR